MPVIYKITNKINGKFYIGKTVNYYKRMWSHKHDRRQITPLTKALDKYGWNNFLQEIIWTGPLNELNEKEIFYIKEYDAIKKGYNCTPGGDGWKSGKEHPLYNKKLPDWWCKKISEGKKRKYHPTRGKKLPLEWANKIGLKNRGENHCYSKRYKIISPAGEIFIIKGLNKFCRENNLIQQNMSKVAVGKRKHHKGWKCEYYE